MPQRFLRPGIRTSASWNRTSFRAQSLYIGILTLVDDQGRYDGRANLLHAEIFGLRDDVKRQQTAADLRELSARGLVLLYTNEGKEYLQVTRWQERIRNKSRFPEPEIANPQPMAADGSQKTLPSPCTSTIASTTSTHSPNGTTAPGADEIYEAYPRHEAKPDALKAIFKAMQHYGSQFLLERTIAYAKTQPLRSRFTPMPATWFNQERFNDNPAEWVRSDKLMSPMSEKDQKLEREIKEAREREQRRKSGQNYPAM